MAVSSLGRGSVRANQREPGGYGSALLISRRFTLTMPPELLNTL